VTATNQQRYFVEISVSGLPFAVEASAIRDVADSHWTPPASEDHEIQERYHNLAEILELPAGAVTRVLLISSAKGLTGFGVGEISKEIIKQASIKPMPAILADWMKHPVVSGFTTNGSGSLLQILDMSVLVKIVSNNQSPPNAGEGKSKS
jgi:chemotaxis protein histidine kinase CheA